MTRLRIRLKRGRDGPNTLVCIRPDGSQTMQHDKTGGFFAVHDLTHYAVETTLNHKRGFYGLVAEGWDLGDFGAFSESNLPILVDIQDWARIPDSFREEIERTGVVIFPGDVRKQP